MCGFIQSIDLRGPLISAILILHQLRLYSIANVHLSYLSWD